MSSLRETRSVAGPDASGMRVDRYLAEHLELFPRSQIAHRDVVVRVNGEVVKLSRKLREEDVVEITYSEPEPAAIEAEPIDLDIMYENDDVVVINKPPGMVVHPAAGNWTGTLAQGLMHHLRELPGRFDDHSRPGIVHRLDKDTSGVLIAAKHPAALAYLAAQFRKRSTKKVYLAIVKGRPPKSIGSISSPIGRDPRNRKRFTVSEAGKSARTEYRVLRHYADYSLMSLEPHTGRTHQLRVHMAALGCPIIGDPIYARPDRRLPGARCALHAFRLTIVLPGEPAPRSFTARPPDDFRALRIAVSGLP
jgi:23S rRNA pseudouridine1911/1915/1917 synthase